jgi:dihydrofolate synthase/folylpolyglutamate synthase
VLPAVDRVATRLGAPTEFEVLTAAAFAELARSDVDLALVEVGMGGRLDATNVLDAGVAVISNVQLDHERYLGGTLTAIGTEKAAIIKRGNLAVTGAGGRGLQPIVERCRRLGVPLALAGQRRPYRATLRDAGWEGLLVDLHSPAGVLREVRIGLLGGHQASNAAIALAVLDALRADAERRDAPSARVDEATIRAGLRDAQWPGRLELLRRTPYGDVLLDGAHNPAGARALARALQELGMRRFPLVLGAMRGKRVRDMLRALAPLDPLPVFTAIDDSGARAPQELLAAWRGLGAGRGRVAAAPDEALLQAAELRHAPDQPVVVAGSLYLVGAVRAMLAGEEAAA